MLGANESLRDTVTQLWCRYLKTCRQAFVEPSKRRVVGIRDTFVSIYPERKRVLGMNIVAKKAGIYFWTLFQCIGFALCKLSGVWGGVVDFDPP